jgi:hypothetical protein
MVTDSDNRIRLAPVSEGVHRPLWSVMFSHISLRAVFASDAGECVVAGDPHQRTIRRETSGGRQWSGARTYARDEPSVKNSTDQ